MDKEQMAIARLQDAARLSLHRFKMPLQVTYSGGKDSQVLLALAERAGIDFEVINSHTTADAPETVHFIRNQFRELELRGGQMRNHKAAVQGKAGIHVDIDSTKRNATNKVCKILLPSIEGIKRKREIQCDGS